MRSEKAMTGCFILKAAVSIIFAALPYVAWCGEFRVTPIRLDFDRGTKSGVITVINEGDEKLSLQMKAFEWSEDGDGKDHYAETKDIIFFPTLMTVEKGGERIIRAGIRIPAIAREKTYRLFIEEIPSPKKPEEIKEGVNVSLVIRFGVPIFSKPMKEDIKGELESLELKGGVFGIPVRNKGNVHFIINSIEIKGKNTKGEGIFSKELSGWYLLGGVSRLYSTPIPQEACKEISRVEVEVKTNRFNLSGKLDVNQAMCSP